MKLFAFLITTILCITTSNIKAQTYDLVWSDEFDYTGLPNSSIWSYDVGGGGWGNNELQYYTDARTENARVENGNLIIEARKEAYGGSAYTSARLITKSKGDWLYGKIDVRAKLPGGTGTWPAIWMLPTDWAYGGWPASGEIDIMEYVGYDPGVVHGTVHTAAYNHTLGTQKGASISVTDAETAFHVYSLIWTPENIKIYVDDTKYFTFFAQGDYTTWPFDKRFHLLLNIAVGGNWGGAQGVDETIFPVRMEVDYVRVYQDKTTSLRELKESKHMSVTPNPAKNIVSLKSEEAFCNIEIHSFSGKKIRDIKTDKSKMAEFDISNLKEGIYFLTIKGNDGNLIGRKKIVKN